jgi:thioredoxin reductase (NADPH)
MAVLDVVIIGAGPAGAAAAVQLRRSGVDFTIFEKKRTGGLLWHANLIENYPGFPRGIRGPDLVRLIEKQLQNLGVKVEKNAVLEVCYQKGFFLIKTSVGNVRSRVLVVATGTLPCRTPERLISSEAAGRVHYEVSRLARRKNLKFAILGGGDAAFDYALNLAHRNKVALIQQSRVPKCLPLLRRRAENHPRISCLNNTRLEAVRRAKKGLSLDLTREGRKITIEVSDLLVAIGRKPSLDIFDQSLKSQATELRTAGRLYLIGDVNNGLLRQAAIAVGDGIKAAMEIVARKEGLRS